MGYGSIQQYLGRIKRFYAGRARKLTALVGGSKAKEIIRALILVSVGICSFLLGQLSVSEQQQSGIVHDSSHRIEYFTPATAEELAKPQGKVVASRNGKRYHYPWCKGATTISEKNRRWFQSEAEAEKAGYTLASNCK